MVILAQLLLYKSIFPLHQNLTQQQQQQQHEI